MAVGKKCKIRNEAVLEFLAIIW